MSRPAALALAAALLLATGGARAEDLPVDLELVLAVDVSESIDAMEARLQREGYAAALTHPEVIRAIAAGSLRRIALTYFEWGESSHQNTVLDWMLVETEADLRKAASVLRDAPYAPARWTSISAAIDFGARRFEDNGFTGTRRVIDISGDGSNNHGRDVMQARDEAVRRNITINGLPIVGDRLSKYGWPRSADMDYYFERVVIGGPGAFIVVAEGPESFATAILRKLIREIAGTGGADTQLAHAAMPE